MGAADPSDEASIAAALRRSMRVLLGAAAIAGAVAAVLWWRSTPAAPEADASAVAAPAEGVPPPDPAESSARFRFREVAAERGIDFVRTNGAEGRKLLPETLGGGVAIADLDGDGAMDLVFVDGDRWPDAGEASPSGQGLVAYLNDGRGFFRRSDATTGLEEPFQGMGIAVGDVDGDRRPDLLATSVSGVRLFLNRSEPGRLRFVDRTIEAGLGDLDGWSTATGFADLDADGHLDLVVAHYVRWSPAIDESVDYRLAGVGRAYGPPLGFEGERVLALFGRGDGTFEDRSDEAGFLVLNPSTGEPMAKALGLLLEDLTGDGAIDAFVANDTVANLLLVNRGDGRFAEDAARRGVAFDRSGAATGAMGVDAIRLAGDGSLAIAVGNFANEPTSLFVAAEAGGRGDRRFTDEAIPAGISAATRPSLTFGVLFADLDLDGDAEFVQVNGHLEDEIARVQASQAYRQRTQLFTAVPGSGGRRFAEIPPERLGDLARPIVGRGLAAGDLDGDGDLDLVATQVAGPPRVLLNESPRRHRSIRVALAHPRGDAAAFGAVVAVTAGGTTRVQTLSPTRSYLSQVEPVLTFGLGDAAKVDRIEVRWNGGGRTVLEHLPAEGTVLVDGAATPADAAVRSPPR
jgi:hypothetical protein